MNHIMRTVWKVPTFAIALLVSSLSLAQQTTLTVAQTFDAQHLDPNVQIAQMSMNVYVNIFDSLLKRDANMIPQPHLATSVVAIDDLTWELKLREGVRFHNGEPFNAEAVKFTIERIFDPATNSALPTWLEGIGEVEILDEHTVRIHTDAPMPLMEQNLTMVYPVPPSYVAEVGNQEFNRSPIGTGPYRLEEWVRDERAVLVANEEYWGERPYYDNVVFRFIPEEASRVAALLAGEVDIVQGVSASSKPQIESRPDLDVRQVQAGRVMLLQLDVESENECLQNADVRRAVALAIDNRALIEFVAQGDGFELTTVVNPHNFGHNADIEPHTYDPDQARDLVAAADCEGMGFIINATPDRQLLSEAIAGQLQQVGINASVVTYESNVWLDRWRNHTLGGQAFMLGLLSQTWDADGLLFLRFGCGEPMSYYCDERLDHLVRQARVVVNPQDRVEMYAEAQEIIHGQAPIVPLYGLVANFGVRNDISWEPRADELMYLNEAAPR